MLEALENRLLLSSSIPLNTSSWTAMGPAPISDQLNGAPAGASFTGRITGIAADPTDASGNTIYVTGANGGVWKRETMDGGNTWTWVPKTDNQPTLAMGAIALAPSNPQIIYAGTGEANNSYDSYSGRGVLKSIDSGTTWTLLTGNANQNEFLGATISRIVVDPGDANTVYVAVAGGGNTGIWKSSSGGTSWTNTTAAAPMAGGVGTTADQFSDLVMDPSNSSTLYAAVGTFSGSGFNGIYKTTNGGGSWAVAGNFPQGNINGSAMGRIALAIAPSASQTLYAAVSDPKGNLLALDVTTNGGTAWNPVATTPSNYLGGQGWYDNVLAVDPSDANRVYVGGVTLLETTDGGSTWTNIINTPTTGSNGLHTDHHAFTFDQGKLLDGNDGGIWSLDNPDPTQNATVWRNLNGNLQITEFTSVALDPSTANVAYGGSQDNGVEKFTDNLAWQIKEGGDGGYMRVDPFQPATVYHVYSNLNGGTFQRSDDGGNSWNAKMTGINNSGGSLTDPAQLFPPFVVDPSTTGRLLFGSDRIYETTDRGEHWHNISTPGSNGWPQGVDQNGNPLTDSNGNPLGIAVNSLAVAASDVNTIYASAGGKIFVTTDRGATWIERDVSANPPGQCHALVVDPLDPMTAYAAFDTGGNQGHVWRTTNGGQLWTDIGGNLPASGVHALVLDAQDHSLYVGNDMGVYACNDTLGSFWYRFGSGFPFTAVSDLQLDTNLQILAAATHGRGLWEIQKVPNLFVRALQPEGTQVTEGLQFTNVRVGAFTDVTGPDNLNNYIATILWGDGSFSIGTIAVDPNLPTLFNITATHTYAEEGSYRLSVSVLDADLSLGGNTITVNVTDAPLSSTGLVNDATEGAAFNGAIASFTDADPSSQATSGNPNGNLADYTATISWGDGFTTSGTVSLDPTTGNYLVNGSHTYAEEGTYTPTVTVNDVGGSSTTTQGTINVADASLTPTTSPLFPYAGAPYTNVVATFRDADPAGTLSDYSATIFWGDSTSSPGTIQADPNFAGLFDVVGTHTYTQTGFDNLLVVIADAGGSTAFAFPTAAVQSLIVNGDPGMGNTITLDNVPGHADTYEVVINGQQRFSGPWSSVPAGITINPGNGVNVTNVEDVASNVPVFVNLGSGTDTVAISPVAHTLDSVQGPVYVRGVTGTSTLLVDDQSGPATSNYQLTALTFNRPNFGGLSYHGITNLTINAGPGNSLGNYQSTQNIYVLGTAAGVTTTIDATIGWHDISVGLPTDPRINTTGLPGTPLDNIQGALTISGQGARDVVNLWDWDSSNAQKTYAFNSTNIAVTTVNGVAVANPVPISWQGVLSVVALWGSAAADTYQFQTLPTGLAAIVVDGYYRANTFQSLLTERRTWAIGPNTTVGSFIPGECAIDLGEVYNFTGGPSGDDFAFVPSFGVNGKLDGVLNGNGGTLDYSQATSPITVNLARDSATNIMGNGLNGFSGIQSVIGNGSNTTLVGSDGTDYWNITGSNQGDLLAQQAHQPGPFTFSQVPNLTGGTGNDVFQFGPGAAVSGAINGGGGFDTLDYSAYLTGVTVNLLTGTATGAGGVANVRNVIGSPFNDTITCDNAGDVINLNGGRDIVRGGAGNDTFVAAAAQLAGTRITGGGAGTLVGANISNTWTINSAGGGNLDGRVTFTGIANLVGGAANDTYRFTGVTPSLAGTISDPGGANRLDYSGYTGGGAITVNLQTSAASLMNGGAPAGFTAGMISSLTGSGNGKDTLIAPNTFNNWSLTGANTGRLNTLTYNRVEHLVGGSNVDVFRFAASGTELSIDGGGAPAGQGDWLDYSGFASAVAVNLGGTTVNSVNPNSATGVAGGAAGALSNIQNVHGGNVANTLIGNSQGNILIGGSGSNTILGGSGMSILIGDTGGGSITGGAAGGDILIADSTTFDTMTTAHELALMSVLAEWQSADSYTDRFNDINQGTAYGPGSHLNGTNVLRWATTVRDNGSPDAPVRVTAAPSLLPLDWFFMDTNDIRVNFEPGEHVNNT